MRARVFVVLQYLLPRHWLTAIVWRVARIRHTPTKNFLITRFARAFDVDLEEVKLEVPDDFATFNDFFVRELKEGAREIDDDDHALVSPVDGTVSAAGRIGGDTIFQAKGLDYSLDDLLATDLDEAAHYIDGRFATIYLAPYNYHRVHAPLAGELVAARYVPGDLFSVNEATTQLVPGLFARNERVICHFSSELGPMAVILVGAIFVGSIETVWHGEVHAQRGQPTKWVYRGDKRLRFDAGAEIGRFNMGSTVIILLPAGSAAWADALGPGSPLRMGQAIGKPLRP